MAGESTYNSISGIVNVIQDVALLTASEQSLMPSLVHTFNDSSSGTGRVWYSYTGGTIVSLAEISDLASQTFTPAAAGTLSPTMFGQQYFLTDLRIASDFNNAAADAGKDLGRVFGVKVDTDLVGLFSSFTGGTVGTAGGTLSWANIMRASAYLRSMFAPQPYVCVLRPEQWYYLASATSGVPTLVPSQNLMNDLTSNFYVSSALGIDFYIDANITSGTAAVGALFSRDAAAYDVRRGFKIETQRDASRGGGGYELNATLIYAKGVYRPTMGAQLIGTSA